MIFFVSVFDDSGEHDEVDDVDDRLNVILDFSKLMYGFPPSACAANIHFTRIPKCLDL